MFSAHRALITATLFLVVGAAAPLSAGELPLYLPTEQKQRVIDIYRQTPELRGLYESRRNWVFVPVLHREMAPGCYLLGVEVGSGAYYLSVQSGEKAARRQLGAAQLHSDERRISHAGLSLLNRKRPVPSRNAQRWGMDIRLFRQVLPTDMDLPIY